MSPLLDTAYLVGVKAAEYCLQTVKLFDFVQHLYSFFSASTHRWNGLASSSGKKLWSSVRLARN